MLLDLDDVLERVRRLDAERESLVALIAAAKAYETAVAGQRTRQRSAFEVPYRGIGGHRTAHAAQVADELIELSGRPVRTPEVLAELQARGSFVPSTNPVNAVAARLSLVPHLKGRRDLGWWPVDRPWPGKR